MASVEPSVANIFRAAVAPVVKLFWETISSAPRPTSSTRAAVTPATPRSSRVEPGLPLMSPDLTAALISPFTSSAFAAADNFLFSNTATATQPVFAAARVFFVSNAFMLKSIWFSDSLFAADCLICNYNDSIE